MKKYTISFPIFYIVFSMVLLCSCGQDDADGRRYKTDQAYAQSLRTTGSLQTFSVKAAASSSVFSDNALEKVGAVISAKAEEQALFEEKSAEIYEAYLSTYSNDDYLFAYCDYDNDGLAELYVRTNEETDSYGRVKKYVDGGLVTIENGIVEKEYINELTWTETMDASANAEKPEMVHEGISAYIAWNDYGTQNLWYPDEEAFLSQYGFSSSTPFYEYALPDGTPRLVLYYDEQTQLGCGLRYYERDPSDIITSGGYGFSFRGLEELPETWEDGLQTDYTKFESVHGDTASETPEYQENIEYDDNGRITHYDSSGVLDYLREDDEPAYLLWMDYIYDENGILIERDYWHNPYQFGTWYQVWTSYFDSFGRLEHEDIYITHGSMDYYYIYTDESNTPTYCLYLDNNLGSWIPEFYKY